MELELYGEEFNKNEAPVDNTQITTTILYFSEEELKQFKQECKIGMRKMFGDQVMTRANISDFLLQTLKNYNSADTKS